MDKHITTLNANSPIPLYQQLYDVIKQQIDTNVLPAGSKIPTEQQLSADYNVSRITVRKAMELLAEDNYIIKRSGKGSFVTPNKINEDISGEQSFTVTCEVNDISSNTILIKAEVRQATNYDVEHLKIPANSKIAYIKRIRYAESTPIMIENIYMNYDLFSYVLDADLEHRSLYSLIDETYPQNERKMKRSLEISIATSEQAKYLKLTKGAPLLLHHEIVTDLAGKPLFRIRQYIAGERVRFITKD